LYSLRVNPLAELYTAPTNKQAAIQKKIDPQKIFPSRPAHDRRKCSNNKG
jgi:hypothetical protein